MRRFRRLIVLLSVLGAFAGAGSATPADAEPQGYATCKVFLLQDEAPVQNGRVFECYY